LSRVQYELCCIFRDYFDAFDRSGLSVRRHLESLQRFNTLFDAIMPQSFIDAGYMTQFVGGLASTVWMALRRNSDARLFMNDMYPCHVTVERYWGTFDVECCFANLVRAAGCYKPDAATVLDLLERIDYLAAILLQSDVDRGFWLPLPRRGNQAQYSASGDPDAPIFSGRVESWVHEEDVGGELPPIKSYGGRLRYVFINYTACARDFGKTISQ